MFGLIGRNISMTGVGLFAPMTGMTGAILSNMVFSDPGASTLTVSNTGDYFVAVSVDGSSNANNTDIEESVFVNGVEVTFLNTSRHYQQANDDGSVSISGLISLTAGDAVTLHFAASTVPTTFQPHNVNLTMFQVS
jgi:hypothetical protein